MFSPGPPITVYIAPGATDMRTSINGLSILIADQLDLDPLGCNTKKVTTRTLKKVLDY